MGERRHHLVALTLFALLLGGCNAVPTAPTIRIVPADPDTTADLTVEITAEAADNGRVLFYRTEWSRDGDHVLALDDETTVPSAETTRDQVWSVSVSAVDDDLDLGEAGTAEVTIANSAPSAQVSISPNPALVYQDLLATFTTTDADEDAVGVIITWTVDGAAQPDLDADVAIPSTLTEAGETWTITVGPTDGTDDGLPVSASVIIGADIRPPASSFCAGGGIATNSTTTGVLCASPLDLATTPATNGTLVWYPGPIQALAP